jgi:hypothetical protein
VSRRIRFDGADNDFQYYSTPSWSGEPVEYDITVCKADGIVKCSCMDSTCRKKSGYVLDEKGNTACKHVSKLIESMARIRREGIETALAA